MFRPLTVGKFQSYETYFTTTPFTFKTLPKVSLRGFYAVFVSSLFSNGEGEINGRTDAVLPCT